MSQSWPCFSSSGIPNTRKAIFSSLHTLIYSLCFDKHERTRASCIPGVTTLLTNPLQFSTKVFHHPHGQPLSLMEVDQAQFSDVVHQGQDTS